MTSFYFTFDITGPARLPRRQEVERCLRDHKCALALQLDANVCLDIANFITGRSRQPEHIKTCVRSLLRSIELSGCDVIPGIGLMELGMKQGTLSLNEDRYASLAKAVWEGIHLNLSAIEADSYTPTGTPKPPAYTPPVGAEVLSLFFEFVYCAFLKLHVLAKSGLSKSTAIGNTVEFLRWTDEELNLSIPFVLQFALGLFGGDTKVRKMLKIDSETTPPSVTAWGATQDVFSLYAFQEAHLVKMAGPTRPVYVTRDTALFEVRRRIDFKGLVVNGGSPLIGFTTVDYDYPHFSDRADEIRDKLAAFQTRRLSSISSSIPPSPRKLIDALEHTLRG